VNIFSIKRTFLKTPFTIKKEKEKHPDLTVDLVGEAVDDGVDEAGGPAEDVGG
jgi:hypothetical protein